jgi:membrane-associated phospholipid phosphatase
MLELLNNIDHQLFLLINRGMVNEFFDFLLPLMRSKFFWSPLYLFLIVYILKTNNTKTGLLTIAFLLITFALGDFISAGIFKESFQRLRPCNEPEFMAYVRNVVGCGSGFSFVSSHATNHFALAVFLGLYFSDFKWIGRLFIAWASIISFAQVYVGVHFPFDVMAGMFLGIGIAYFSFYFYHRIRKQIWIS